MYCWIEPVKQKSNADFFKLTSRERSYLKNHGGLKHYERMLALQPPFVIYKFVQEEEHAEALVRGDVFLSTLGTCRAYECRERGDIEEGKITHFVERFSGSPDEWRAYDPLGGRVLDISGPGHLEMIGCELVATVQDAYVFCATDRFAEGLLAESFGQYCVRIRNPVFFQLALGFALSKKVGPVNCWGQKVHYTDRFIFDDQPLPTLEFFIKPPSYRLQSEYRVALIVRRITHQYIPEVVRVENISRFVERIR